MVLRQKNGATRDGDGEMGGGVTIRKGGGPGENRSDQIGATAAAEGAKGSDDPSAALTGFANGGAQGEARKRSNPEDKAVALYDIERMIDADVYNYEAHRLKGIAKRAIDLAQCGADLARIKRALQDEIERQKKGGRDYLQPPLGVDPNDGAWISGQWYHRSVCLASPM
jgi:hypothetical protein